MYTSICTSLAPEWLDEFYSYSEFNSLSAIGPCPVNMNVLASKTGALQIGVKKQNGDSLENVSNDIDHILMTYGNHLPT
jgi:hypothetical protein